MTSTVVLRKGTDTMSYILECSKCKSLLLIPEKDVKMKDNWLCVGSPPVTFYCPECKEDIYEQKTMNGTFFRIQHHMGLLYCRALNLT